MKNIRLYYCIYTVALVLGLMAFLHGSRLIVNTYQRESLSVETARIGRRPIDGHEELAAKRGIKDGVQDLLVQLSGLTVSLVSVGFLLKTGRGKGGQ